MDFHSEINELNWIELLDRSQPQIYPPITLNRWWEEHFGVCVCGILKL